MTGNVTTPATQPCTRRAARFTFTIDADRVLEDRDVGDADIERKLKKLVARAAEVQKNKAVQVAADPMPGST
ncbi:MAG TPA: hypothetical protein VGL22_15165 [Terracidiphilus sp.]